MKLGISIAVPLLALLLVRAFAAPFFAEPVLIANENIAVDHVSPDQVQKLYLGTATRLDETRVRLATLEGGATHEMFIRDFLNRSPSQFVNHWRKIVYSGKGGAPHACASDDEVIAFVASTPGAIGYIDASTPHVGVKVLRIE